MAAYYTSLQVRQSLKSLGFSDNEINILTFLFHVKKSSTEEISRQTAISLSSTQYGLNHLCSRNITRCSLRQKEDVFEICSDKEFFDWIDEQKQINQDIYEHAKQDISGFLSSMKESSWKPEVTYYEGVEGIKEIYENMLETAEKADKKIYSWLDISKIQESLGDYLFEYIKKRMEKNIVSHDIVPKNKVNVKHAEKKEKREIKFVDNLPIDGEIRIYGDKVSVITFNEKKLIGFVFQGSIITSLFRAIFENAWNR
ncbi:hypothetical protein K9L27_03440 [Candidatus Gracilibacteria bacterium]|nr:hypothetical protein [Candidatus Gracilibacteria bacterium]